MIADTRIEAEVQRDADGPVASSIRDSPSSSPSLSGADALGTTPRSKGATERLTFGGRGIHQPAVVAEWKALPNCVFSLEWIQDDKVIALACGDNRCRLHHVETQQEVRSATVHYNIVLLYCTALFTMILPVDHTRRTCTSPNPAAWLSYGMTQNFKYCGSRGRQRVESPRLSSLDTALHVPQQSWVKLIIP